jgi:hypothetical protein
MHTDERTRKHANTHPAHEQQDGKNQLAQEAKSLAELAQQIAASKRSAGGGRGSRGGGRGSRYVHIFMYGWMYVCVCVRHTYLILYI